MSSQFLELEIEEMRAISAEMAWQYRIIPAVVKDDILKLYYDTDRTEVASLKTELQVILGKKIELLSASSDVIEATLNKYYIQGENQLKSSVNLGIEYNSNEFVKELIMEAQELGSSDIHIEAHQDKGRIRIRVDGLLIERFTVIKTDYPALVNQLKIMSNLDISEKRLPQDGRMKYSIDENNFDVRVSILPTIYGEKLVLRILDGNNKKNTLSSLGLTTKQLVAFENALKKSNGLILLSGPTGSGKSTTLYAALNQLNNIQKNIITIEDPVEYTIDGINQVHLKENIGLTFASALKSFLRQDPDIIMVGEIRDTETAQMTIRASLTGHLVLSTVHANSAWGIISRLVDMGVPKFLLMSTLNLTIAQRLIPLLCECKTLCATPVQNEILKGISHVYEANGCSRCHFTGYKGRRAVFEMIPITPTIAPYIDGNKNADELNITKHQIGNLREGVINLFIEGSIGLDEVLPYLT